MRTVAIIALVLVAFAAGVAINFDRAAEPDGPWTAYASDEPGPWTDYVQPPAPAAPPGAIAVSQDEVDRVNEEQARLRQVEVEAKVAARAVADELRK